jgi:5'-methylthioadenosine/S-adenosylhomocysteine nucleosidase
MKKRIALLMAMEAEASPLIQALGLKPALKPADRRLPFLYYEGSFRGLELTLALNGKDARRGVDNIGTEPAALNAYVLCRDYSPNLIVNAGTAGGFQKHGAQIGDIYLSSDSFRYHDHRIPIPGFEEYGIGSYPTLDVSDLAAKLGYKTGVVSTGNALDYTDSCIAIMNSNNARVKEMEATAVAWVCDTMKVPFFAVKSITDIVDGEHPSAEEFLRNLALASESLAQSVPRILEALSRH